MSGLAFSCTHLNVCRTGGVQVAAPYSLAQPSSASPSDSTGRPSPETGAAPLVAPSATALAIKQLSLKIGSGEQVAVIGSSGAGKTTLLNTFAAALKPTDGTVKINAHNPWRLGNYRRRMLRRQLFLAPQTPPLPPRQRVATAVLAGRVPVWSLVKSLSSLVRTKEAELAFDALNAFSIGDKLWHRVDRLSGGERQRVSLARALVSDTSAMLVDEPLSALDPALAGQTLRALIDHSAQNSKTLICSLHQVELALGHFPRVIGLKNGELLFDMASDAITDDIIRELYFGSSDKANNDLSETSASINPVIATPTRCI